MAAQSSLEFKIALEAWEFEQIQRLNYQTFVEEIPQHEANLNQTLEDKFHAENLYIICLHGKQLAGMIAVRDKRPFSLDRKLENLDVYLPPGRSVCEIRLLAVQKNYRNGRVLAGIMQLLAEHCLIRGYDLAVISGTVRQQKLYRHIGFVPFGPLVGEPSARFQPMYLTLEKFKELKAKSKVLAVPGASPRTGKAPATIPARVNLLPGPVGVSAEVRQVFGEVPVSHRADSFVQDYRHTQGLLCRLTGARHAAIFMGSGTLANDVIAGQLSLSPGSGLILSNGEFGSRLTDHATRCGLSFKTLQLDWGEAFYGDLVREFIHRHPGIEWLWAVHCETSTGVLNDLAMLKKVCATEKIRLCLDCISSLGTVPVDLRGVYLVSGSSGKGLRALPGLSVVFSNHEVRPAPDALPRYMDLGLYTADNIPFTISSNLLYAFKTALEQLLTKGRYHDTAALSAWLRSMGRSMGLQIVAPDADASPAVVTIALPGTICSENLGRQLAESGYLLSYNSEYLRRRNWIQICLMSEVAPEILMPLVQALSAKD